MQGDNKSVSYEPISAMDRISLDFLKSAWNSKIFILLTMLLFMGITAGYTVYTKYLNLTDTYLYAVNLTFDGIDQNEYPNGNRFSLSDFKDTGILQRVHEKNALEKFGWTPNDLSQSLSVATTGAEQFALIREFEILTKDWAATIGELERVKEDFQNKLNATPKNRIRLSLIDYDGGLPASVAKKVMIDIVATWAEIFTKERGVASYQIASIPTASIGLNKLTNPDSVEALAIIGRQLRAVQSFANNLEMISGSKSATDPETEKNLVSIQQDISVIRQALNSVPKNWSRDVSRYNGRNLLPIEVYSSNIFDSSLLENKDYLVALDIVEDRIKLLQRDINKLLERPMGGRVTDPKTGNTAYEVDQFLSDIIRVDLNILRGTIVELGISKNIAASKLYYQTQIKALTREKASLNQKISVIRNALDNGQTVLGDGLDKTAPSASGNAQQSPSSAQISLPQNGEGFVDRLIELGERSGNDQFLRALIDQISDLGLQGAELDKRISRLEYYVVQIGSGTASDSAQKQLANSFANEMDEKLSEVMNRLQGYADSVNRIAGRLAFAGEIHSALFPGENASENVGDYVVDGANDTIQMENIISELAEVNGITIRIANVLNANNLNPDGAMYSATSDVSKLPANLIDRRSILVVLMSSFAGFLFALMIIAVLSVREAATIQNRNSK